jgi:scyllo-inosamine 4-kinase
MGTTDGEMGSTFSQVRARTALRDAGLDETVPMERASSVTNEVWLTANHVIRVNRRRDNRLQREAMLAAVMPPEVGYPTVVAHGGRPGEDWLVCERVPGRPLAHWWPDLTKADRERAVRQLAARLAALHRTQVPDDLPPIQHAPQLLEVGSADPTGPLLAAIDKIGEAEHVSPFMLEEASALVRELAWTLQPFESDTIVHGDVTFENVLWNGQEVTALLDVEWARRGPPDLDLDILLRCAAYPDLHVAEAYADRTHAEDYKEVPWWLADAYPALFQFPRQLDRMRVYSIAYDVRDLLAYPPQSSPRQLSPLHAYHRLMRVVQGRSYLDELG